MTESSAASQWRTFIAIELPDSIKEALILIRRKVQLGPGRAIRWIPADGIHLTLRFLGDVNADRVPQIADRMRAAAAQSGNFSLELGPVGVFPPSGAPRVFWVGVRGELQRLNSLQARLEGALSTIGFDPEERPYHPHLTVGRTASWARSHEALAARAAFTRLMVEGGRRFDVRSITLWRSHLQEDGARYESLDTVRLVGSG